VSRIIQKVCFRRLEGDILKIEKNEKK